jgi:molybdopterin converting factor small subunit
VRVLLFGVYRELAGEAEIEIKLPSGSTLARLVSELRTLPGLDRLPERPAVARNLRYAGLGEILATGDEVALIPPVAGG